MTDQDLGLHRIEPAVVDLERLAPRKEEPLSLVVSNIPEHELVLPGPDAGSERRPTEADLLAKLSERRCFVRFPRLETAAGRDPDVFGRRSARPEEQDPPAGVDQDDARGVARNDARAQSFTRATDRPSRIGTTTLSSRASFATSSL